MPVPRFPVDVVMERVPLANRWVAEKWQPAAVVPAGAPVMDCEIEPGVPELLHDGPSGTQWRFPRMALELHRSEGEGYYLNITAPQPRVFVMWRTFDDGGEPPARPVIATVSYNEAARMMDGGEQVDSVAMPLPVLAWLQPFVAENYTPEPRKKVRRNDPFAAEQPADRRNGRRTGV
jgi:hypothetical protein